MRPRWRSSALLILLAVSSWSVAHVGGQPPATRLRQAMTNAEFTRCGLHKLTQGELAALEQWLAARGQAAGGTARDPHPGTEMDRRLAEAVAFNVKSGKYHCPACVWARQCTRNCVNITLGEALERGGVACKVCRGSCP